MASRHLSIVVPCFNEASGLDAFFQRLEVTLVSLASYTYEIICIDDGSRDNTLDILLIHADRNPCIRVIELSRNFGKEAALTAGIDQATGDAVIPIDADLQHPPEVIAKMVTQWEQGSDVVLALRKIKSKPAGLQHIKKAFYRLYNRISDSPIPPEASDFRLMDQRVIAAIKLLPERRRFMKGLFTWVGFRTSTVEFDVESRQSGQSSFNTFRLWRLAVEGITSFSTLPLSVWIYIGFNVALLALIYGSWIIIKTLVYGVDLPGYASIIVAVLFIGGIQLMGIGILGEYIGRIYSETKQRPVYIIRQLYQGNKGAENNK